MRRSWVSERVTCRKQSPRRGTAAVEAAAVMPVVLILLLGCVDFGRVIHTQIALANAARVGAEYGAVHPYAESSREDWELRLRQAATEEVAALSSFYPDQFQLDVAVFGASRDDREVIVTARYVFRTMVDWPGLPHVLNLNHMVGMRQYR